MDEPNVFAVVAWGVMTLFLWVVAVCITHFGLVDEDTYDARNLARWRLASIFLGWLTIPAWALWALYVIFRTAVATCQKMWIATVWRFVRHVSCLFRDAFGKE